MAITILVDDQAGGGLTAEHGLALWIEVQGRHILFDTGQGGALLPNARVLGIDLATVDAIVLSHGHYDHAGGLASVLPLAASAQVYHHPAALKERYSLKSVNATPVGMPDASLRALAAVAGDRLHAVSKPTLLWPGIGVTGRIDRDQRFEQRGGEFSDDPAGHRSDAFDDDMALWVVTPQGLLVFTGCGHAGLNNTVRQSLRQSSAGRLRMVVGGFHLGMADNDRIEKTAGMLASYEPCLVVPCHCTGERAVKALRGQLGDHLMPGVAGSGIVI